MKLILALIPLIFLLQSAVASDTTWVKMKTLAWSHPLNGRYDNLDLDGTSAQNGVIQKSAATEACATIGGTLPTLSDFEDLGRQDYLAVFPEMAEHRFWTSTVYVDYPNYAYVFVGSLGSPSGTGNRGFEDSVICVRHFPTSP
jgi:hypothetical protein